MTGEYLFVQQCCRQLGASFGQIYICRNDILRHISRHGDRKLHYGRLATLRRRDAFCGGQTAGIRNECMHPANRGVECALRADMSRTYTTVSANAHCDRSAR